MAGFDDIFYSFKMIGLLNLDGLLGLILHGQLQFYDLIYGFLALLTDLIDQIERGIVDKLMCLLSHGLIDRMGNDLLKIIIGSKMIVQYNLFSRLVLDQIRLIVVRFIIFCVISISAIAILGISA